MKVLVIGRGGREHALVKALTFSPQVEQIHALPGSHGIKSHALCHPVDSLDFSAVFNVVKKYSIDLVIIGPETEIAKGLGDYLREQGVLVFSPSQEASQLESSKIFCKEFLKEANVNTAPYEIIDSVDTCLNQVEKFTPPYVLKADGLAAGKGVFICSSKEELKKCAKGIFEEKWFGESGKRAILEQFQKGWELSYLIVTNGMDYKPFPLAQDHKTLKDNDEGPNTGGMGVVAPLRIDLSLEEEIQNKILRPIVDELNKRKMIYRGVLYVGIMVTETGPSVLEINVRFGDPEAQVILPLLDGDWSEVFMQVAKGELMDLNWKPLFSSCVVMAAAGYPEQVKNGDLIQGDIKFETPSSYYLHAGTQLNIKNEWTTHGGRILNAIGIGSSLKESLDLSYAQAAKVNWPGMQMRKDIGSKILKST
jgi:phosphoribosylamine--glycine ligase